MIFDLRGHRAEDAVRRANTMDMILAGLDFPGKLILERRSMVFIIVPGAMLWIDRESGQPNSRFIDEYIGSCNLPGTRTLPTKRYVSAALPRS